MSIHFRFVCTPSCCTGNRSFSRHDKTRTKRGNRHKDRIRSERLIVERRPDLCPDLGSIVNEKRGSINTDTKVLTPVWNDETLFSCSKLDKNILNTGKNIHIRLLVESYSLRTWKLWLSSASWRVYSDLLWISMLMIKLYMCTPPKHEINRTWQLISLSSTSSLDREKLVGHIQYIDN